MTNEKVKTVRLDILDGSSEPLLLVVHDSTGKILHTERLKTTDTDECEAPATP